MSIVTIGLDLAKSVFQVHGVDEEGQAVVRKRLRRGEVLKFFEGLAPCRVGMEAASTATDVRSRPWPLNEPPLMSRRARHDQQQ